MGKNLIFSLQKINLHVFYTQINKKLKELFKVHQLSLEKHFFSQVTIVTVGAVYITNAKSITNDHFAVFFPM